MELASNSVGAITPSKHQQQRSSSINAENLNPNVSPHHSPLLKQPSNSPVAKSATKSQKAASFSKNPNNNNPVVHLPQNRIRQRKFVVAKKNPNKNKTDTATSVSCKCKDKGVGNAKCLCVAYENLRASQEDFFKNRGEEKACDEEEEAESALMEVSLMIQDLQIEGRRTAEEEEEDGSAAKELEGSSSSAVKRRRDRLLEEARNSVPESGSGRVMHLVKAFEKLLSIPNSSKEKEKDQKEEEEEEKHQHHHEENNNKSKVMKWALPGLQLQQQQPPKAPETEVSDSGYCSSSFCCTSELVLTSENLGLDKRISVSSSWDSSRGSCSVSSRTSSGGRRSRRNSLESSGTFGGRRWKKKQQLKVTSQKPFKLRTEQRGKLKEEEFMKKIQEMMAEEEKQRVPIAQGLPWTTDEPECLLKPPVKESTRPIDLKLHSDVRAIDRAEFDHQVAEKMSVIEQLKLERERQQKLAEEEEIRRLRKELIPKAQPMPYFDRPFVPRRSMKHPTIPREPKFHIPQHKKIKCCLSWNDMSPYSSYLN